MSELALHLIIHGRVQGVGYRAWTVARAREHGLAGWVRNRRDGTVEAVVTGTAASVEKMAIDCWEGPLAARVTTIDSKEWHGEREVEFTSRATV